MKFTDSQMEYEVSAETVNRALSIWSLDAERDKLNTERAKP